MTKKKKTTKKKTIEVRQGDKSKFVRALTRTLPARDVQARAARAGMKMSIPYIHNIRSAATKKSREILKRSARKPIKGTRKQKEALFLDLVVHIGAQRAQALLKKAEFALKLDATT